MNSWQSFKNRCDAAQRKQKIWLSTSGSDGKVQSTGQSLLKNQLNGHGNQLKPALENAQQKFQEKQAELQRRKLQELVKQQQSNEIDTSFIKSEPASDDVSLLFLSFVNILYSLADKHHLLIYIPIPIYFFYRRMRRMLWN